MLLVPGVNLIALLVLATKEWPVERELARLRLLAGESKDTDADIDSVMSLAIAQEQKRKWDRALSLYRLAAERSSDARLKEYATECAQRLTDNRSA